MICLPPYGVISRCVIKVINVALTSQDVGLMHQLLREELWLHLTDGDFSWL